MRAQRRHALRDGIALFAVEDLQHGNRQDPLPRFLKRAVEDLIQFRLQNKRRHHSRRRPQHRQPKCQRQRQPPLQAARQGHLTRPEAIADAAHGFDDLVPQFLAQAADMDLDRVAFDLVIERVEPLVQLRLRHQLAGALHEGLEKGPIRGRSASPVSLRG